MSHKPSFIIMTNRRSFIKKTVAVGAVAAVSDFDKLLAQTPAPQQAKGATDLVAVRDGSRADMVKKAIEELGGIKNFVKPDQKVVIKPNIGWNKGPEFGSNTHPETVGAIVALCKEAGAKDIVVFDHCCHDGAYEGSGIKEVVEKMGGRMVTGADQKLYKEVDIPQGKKLTKAQVHQDVLDCDVFITCPPLKHHSGSEMTACMKNAMGIVWDRGAFHKNDLHQCIADSVYIRKPDLCILDAYMPMVRNGPVGKDKNDLVERKTLMASRDIVAIDAAGAALLNQAGKIRHVQLGEEMGIGCANLSKLNIKRLSLS